MTDHKGGGTLAPVSVEDVALPTDPCPATNYGSAFEPSFREREF
jgi:hypothetical protein